LFRASHLWLRCIGNLLCIGLFLCFRPTPSRGSAHVSNDRLAAGVDVDVLNSDLLLALAAMAVQRLNEQDMRSR
jgi:hypothetical protein